MRYILASLQTVEPRRGPFRYKVDFPQDGAAGFLGRIAGVRSWVPGRLRLETVGVVEGGTKASCTSTDMQASTCG